jgi:3-oxoadipate enol-lactonase
MTTHLINNIAVEISGEGDPLLCIHGLGGSSNTWTPVMGALSQFKVIRVDLPGSARSTLPKDTLSIDLYVRTIEQLLFALQLNAVHVAAHSLGTIVAQHFAVRNTESVKSLVLLGPLVAPPDPARPNIAARARLARQGINGMQEIADAIVAAATSKETKEQQPTAVALVRESIMRQSPEGYAQSCEALAEAQGAKIEQISVPTLLVTGDQDGVAPVGAVSEMAERIKGSQMVAFNGCGHWTTFEKPQECMHEFKNFYRSIH